MQTKALEQANIQSAEIAQEFNLIHGLTLEGGIKMKLQNYLSVWFLIFSGYFIIFILIMKDIVDKLEIIIKLLGG